VTLQEVLDEIKAVREENKVERENLARMYAEIQKANGIAQLNTRNMETQAAALATQIDRFRIVLTPHTDSLRKLHTGTARAFQRLGIDDGTTKPVPLAEEIDGAEKEYVAFVSAQARRDDLLIPRVDALGREIQPNKAAMAAAEAALDKASEVFKAAYARATEQRTARLARAAEEKVAKAKPPSMLSAAAAAWAFAVQKFEGPDALSTINVAEAEFLVEAMQVIAARVESPGESRSLACLMSVLMYFFRDDTTERERTPGKLLDRVLGGAYVEAVLEEVGDGADDHWTRDSVVALTQAAPQ